MKLQSFDEMLANQINFQRAREKAMIILAAERAGEMRLDIPDLSLATFVDQSDVVADWRIDGLHVVGHNTTITAAYKTGKSTLMLNLLRSLADGTPFIGRNVVKPEGRIAYWNLEVSDTQMRDWCRTIGVQNPDRVVVANLRGRRTNLWNDEALDSIVEWHKRNEIECWIIDPGARLLPGWPGAGNPENDNGVIGDLTDRLDQVKYRATIEDLFLPLHTGRQGTHSRGATRYDDWTDVRWLMERDAEKIRFLSADGRDVDVAKFPLTFDPKTLTLSQEETLEQMQLSLQARSVVVALHAAGRALNTTELRALMKGDTGTRGAAIGEAVRRGWVRMEQRKQAQLYSVSLTNPDVQDILITYGNEA